MHFYVDGIGKPIFFVWGGGGGNQLVQLGARQKVLKKHLNIIHLRTLQCEITIQIKQLAIRTWKMYDLHYLIIICKSATIKYNPLS